MMALSIQQPWAWLIVNGHKDIENRSWPTNYRGPVAIHAGKKYDVEGEAWIHDNFGGVITLPLNFDQGGVVGTAEIADCVSKSGSDWFFGPFGFVLKNAEPCELQPMRGQLGFFAVPEDIVSVLRRRGARTND